MPSSGAGAWLVRGEWLRSVFDLPLAAAPSTLDGAGGLVRVRRRRAIVCTRAGRSAPASSGSTFSTCIAADGVDADALGRAGRSRRGRASDSALRGASNCAAGWQHNWRTAGRVHERGYPAAQILYWF